MYNCSTPTSRSLELLGWRRKGKCAVHFLHFRSRSLRLFEEKCSKCKVHPAVFSSVDGPGEFEREMDDRRGGSVAESGRVWRPGADHVVVFGSGSTSTRPLVSNST